MIMLVKDVILVRHIRYYRLGHLLDLCLPTFDSKGHGSTNMSLLYVQIKDINSDRIAHEFVLLLAANPSCSSHPLGHGEFIHFEVHNLSAFLS